ncbi:hypothetical protein LTR10_016068 [Elasticomyces elasticus]|uniref:Metallo-beta-lactamase domain-containing protein n=1 Tax=Exophiala sideris TaxID=1016849 RepID=A0ABR0J1G4_9EURO|nr:hypothetical protein LTR10_016068 [Elasticomyces elasticus]KAK5024595.1 hypothetical protein LTS07_008441 [Exophiala sideris]KAK5030689.1 hypothetical protein LTR13_008043 [Exophiala sideris]KAK5054228.1 hypothetical protein LTR69_008843 [Exophiala sideris]KAK5179630.1 hypothetical protein LTR44_007798 [Eurotiomycetes sp. CCFEE 6388]
MGININSSPLNDGLLQDNATAVVEVQILDGGSFTANGSKVMAGAPDRTYSVPDWAFLVRDCESGRVLLWDYGLSEVHEEFTPFVQNNLLGELSPRSPATSIAQQIVERNGIAGADLETIIFSHAHWDHCRPFWKDFPHANALFGPGTFNQCRPAHLKSPGSQWDGRIFDDPEAFKKCRELEGPWVSFGPFEKAMDFFGNGSFWVIQAPGHMIGNLIAAARVQGGTWIVMAGDCCHARQIYQGLHDFAVFTLPGGQKACLQEDLTAAKDTLRRIRRFEDTHSAKVCLAHDATWINPVTPDELLMSLLDEGVRKTFQASLFSG